MGRKLVHRGLKLLVGLLQVGSRLLLIGRGGRLVVMGFILTGLIRRLRGVFQRTSGLRGSRLGQLLRLFRQFTDLGLVGLLVLGRLLGLGRLLRIGRLLGLGALLGVGLFGLGALLGVGLFGLGALLGVGLLGLDALLGVGLFGLRALLGVGLFGLRTLLGVGCLFGGLLGLGLLLLGLGHFLAGLG